MNLAAFSQYGMIAAVVVMFTSFAGIVTAIGLNRAVTLSLHAAAHRNAHMAFAACLTAGVLLMTFYEQLWLSPIKHIGPAYDAVFLTVMVCTVLVGWVPDRKGWQRYVHLTSAFVLFLLLPILNLLMALTPTLGTVARTLAAAAVALQVYYLVAFLFAKRSRHNLLVHQLAYLLASSGVLVVVPFV